MVSFEEEEELYNVTNARIKHIKLERKERRDEKLHILKRGSKTYCM